MIRSLIALGFCSLLVGCANMSSTDDNPGADTSVIPKAAVDTQERRRARIRLELAAGHYQQRNYPTALEELREALTIDPDYAAAYGMLGLVYMDLKDEPKAESSFRKALALAPGNADLRNNYGWFLCQAGRPAEAIPEFERAAGDKVYASPSKPLHNAGICLRRMGDPVAAERYLQRSFKADPRNPVAMFNLGEIYLERNELDNAQFYAQRLIKNFDPSAQTIWLALRVEHARDNRDAYLSLGSQLRRKFPDSREASLLREGRLND